MGCGPSACENSVVAAHETRPRLPAPSQSSSSPVAVASAEATGHRLPGNSNFSILVENSRQSPGQRITAQPSTLQLITLSNRLLHSRHMLALRETLEYELNQQAEDENEASVQERQIRVDGLLARMMFEEELSTLEINRLRGGINVWQENSRLRAASPVQPPPRKGLLPEEIEQASHRHLYAKEKDVIPDEERTYCYECILCLAEYAEGDELRTLECEHIFHVACVDEWLKRNKTCPLCSEVIGSREVKASEEMASTDFSALRISHVGRRGSLSLSESADHMGPMDQGPDSPSRHQRFAVPEESNKDDSEGGIAEEEEEEEEEEDIDDERHPLHPAPTFVIPLTGSQCSDAQLAGGLPSSMQHKPASASQRTSPTLSPLPWAAMGLDDPVSSVLVQPSYIEDCQVRYSPLSCSSAASTDRFHSDRPQRSYSPTLPTPLLTGDRGCMGWGTSAYTDDMSSSGCSHDGGDCGSASLPGEVPQEVPFSAPHSLSYGNMAHRKRLPDTCRPSSC